MSQLQPRTKYTPHRILRDGSVFIAVADSDLVIEVRPVITKVTYVVNEKGEPMLAPDGNKNYGVSWTIVTNVLTKAEWSVRKQLLENGEI